MLLLVEHVTFKLEDKEFRLKDFLRGLNKGLSAEMEGGGESVRWGW